MRSHTATSQVHTGLFVAAATLLLAASTAPTVSAIPWDSLAATNTGPATIYGKPGSTTNGNGACSYGGNMADTTGLPFSTAPAGASDGGTGSDVTYVALNNAQFDNSKSCGTCLWFRGTGEGVGVESRKVSSEWQYGVVDNECPECPKGAIDLARSFDVGDGIWGVEWFAVPCNVGDSSLHYSIVDSSPFFFLLVVSNGAVPVESVSMEVGGKSVPLVRTTNNNYRYNGDYSFPMKVTVTPICGEAVTDTIKSAKGGDGTAQFSADACKNQGNPTTGGGGGGGSVDDSDSVDTESSGSAARAMVRESSPPVASDSAASPPAVTAELDAAVIAEPPAADSADAPATDATTPPAAESPAAAAPQQPSAADEPESQPPSSAEPPAEEARRRHLDAPKPPLDQLLATPPESAPEPSVESPLAPEPSAAESALAPEPSAAESALVPEPSAAEPPVEESTPPVVSAEAKPEQRVEGAVTQLFSGVLGRKAALPPWFQCGDSRGQYTDAVCGAEGFTCTRVAANYMQCRDDAGPEGNLSPTAAAEADKYGRIETEGGKALLPQFYQCGDRRGAYPDTACKDDGFKCVAVTDWFMQCRNDQGGPQVQGRRLLAAGRKMLQQ